MMRNFTLGIFALLLTTSLFAQDRVVGNAKSAMKFPAMLDKTNDTLTTPFPRAGCPDSIFVYAGYDNNQVYQGYITGTNGFGDKTKGQLMHNVNSNTQVIASFAFVAAVTGNGSYNGTIWTVASGLPATLTGTSLAVTGSTLTAGGVATFLFPTAAPVTGDFFVCVSVTGAAGDTIAFPTSKAGCGANESVEKWGDDTWHTISSAWGADMDILMGAIANKDNAGTENFGVVTNNVIFPNPSSEHAVISYTTVEAGKVNITVKNLAGQTILNISEGQKTAGTYVKALDVTQLAAGIYMYQIELNGKTATDKFVVKK